MTIAYPLINFKHEADGSWKDDMRVNNRPSVNVTYEWLGNMVISADPPALKTPLFIGKPRAIPPPPALGNHAIQLGHMGARVGEDAAYGVLVLRHKEEGGIMNVSTRKQRTRAGFVAGLLLGLAGFTIASPPGAKAQRAHRLMGDWEPNPAFYAALLGQETSDADVSRPYPFCLAHPFEAELSSLGDVSAGNPGWRCLADPGAVAQVAGACGAVPFVRLALDCDDGRNRRVHQSLARSQCRYVVSVWIVVRPCGAKPAKEMAAPGFCSFARPGSAVDPLAIQLAGRRA